MRAKAGALVVTGMLALAAQADAALPIEGSWWNHSQARGGYLETTHHTFRTFWLFCKRDHWSGYRQELREGRYEVPTPLHIHADGSFSFHGKGLRYGPEGEPLGHWKMQVTGRFVTPRKVRIERTLKGCGHPGTITIRAERQT